MNKVKMIVSILLSAAMMLGCGTITIDAFIGKPAVQEAINPVATEASAPYETVNTVEISAETSGHEHDPAEIENPDKELYSDVNETEYHITALTEEEAFELGVVPVYAEWFEIPVYARLNEEGSVVFYTFAHEHKNGLAGFLPIEFSEPDEDMNVSVGINAEAGFIEFDDPAEIILFEDESVAYHGVVWGHIKDNESINLFYPVLEDGVLMNGAIPVMVTPYDLDDIENSLTICYELYPDVLLLIKSAELINGESDMTPEATETPVATPAYATQTPDATQQPETTQKPTNTPYPTPTPKPTNPPEPTPTPFVWKCMYCGKTFGSSDADYEAWYQHAWYNPGCYAAGHAVTPAPTPTPTPSHPAENGHWEEVWVVDVPMVCHTVWVCNVCGWETTDKEAKTAHQVDHINAGEGTGYHSYVVIDQEEQGHWETVWVPDP